MKKLCQLGLVGGAVLTLTSCAGREHLSENHGRSFHTVFFRQPVNSPHDEKIAEPTKGLDSEEAATIAATYKRDLAGKGAQNQSQQPVMLIAPPPNAQGSQYSLPPPSVPKE